MFDGIEDMHVPNIRFPGIFLAEVIDTSSDGRAQLRVFPMMVGLAESVLPWALPAFGLFEGAAVSQGSFTVPAVNSRVYVFFVGGDVTSPVYFANAPGATEIPTGGSVTRKVWQTRSGHTVEIEDASGSEFIKVTHKDGALIELDSSGNIKVTAKSGSEVQLGAGGTVKKLLNEAAATLFNAHTHGPGSFVAGGNPVTGTSATPGSSMGSSEQTAETKAS